MLARFLLHIWFILWFPAVISLTFSVHFPWLTSVWVILGLFTTRPRNLFVHGTLCMLTLGIHEIFIYLMHKVTMKSEWTESLAFPVWRLQKSLQLQKAAHLQFRLLSWDADTRFENMVIYSFQLSLFANIWTPVNYHCWHKQCLQLHSLNLILNELVNPVKFYCWSLNVGKKYKIQYNFQHRLI